MSIKISDLSFRYSQKQSLILNNINIELVDGETVAILGASGSGKSTLFNIITSLYKPTKGQIKFGNSKLLDLAYIRQSAMDMVFPWKTVVENINFALKERKILNSKSIKKVKKLLDILRLTKRKNYYPNQLSGGELKRLSFACGLSYSPKILLLDEAFAGVDLSLKLELWSFLKNEIYTNKITTIVISHDFDEAIFLADRIVFLDQTGTIFSKQILINKKLKESNKSIENYFSKLEIVEIKKDAIETFRKLNKND